MEENTDTLLWEALYRALLMMAQAIKRHKLDKKTPVDV